MGGKKSEYGFHKYKIPFFFKWWLPLSKFQSYVASRFWELLVRQPLPNQRRIKVCSENTLICTNDSIAPLLTSDGGWVTTEASNQTRHPSPRARKGDRQDCRAREGGKWNKEKFGKYPVILHLISNNHNMVHMHMSICGAEWQWWNFHRDKKNAIQRPRIASKWKGQKSKQQNLILLFTLLTFSPKVQVGGGNRLTNWHFSELSIKIRICHCRSIGFTFNTL